MKLQGQPRIEAVLRTQWGQAGFVFLIVLIVSLAMSVPRFEIAELRGREFNRGEILLAEFLRWGAWGLMAWPIVHLARWTMERSNSLLLLFLTQLPLSAGVGWAALHLDFALRDLRAPAGRQADDPRGRERRPPGDFAPDRPARPDRAGRPPEDRPWMRGSRRSSESPSLDVVFWRHRWMSAILVYWVVLGMGGGLHSFLAMREKERSAADLELRAERLRAELSQAQLGALRNQLNPHFLFNALHSVGGLIRGGREKSALSTLAAIGELLRATLEYGGTEEVPLSEELQIVERFLEIERIRLGERLETVFDVPEELEIALVPTLLLLPLVENAVRHGIALRTEGGRVVVTARRSGDRLFLEMLDDGLGFSPDVLEQRGIRKGKERRSIGLQNTRSRLRALYDEDQSFSLSNAEPQGACVRITLPYRVKGQGAERGGGV